jgi:hypothetical protein
MCIELALAFDNPSGMYNYVMASVPSDECRRHLRSCIITSLDELFAMGYVTKHSDSRKKEKWVLNFYMD